jgi:hypothetical protein
MVFKKDVFDLGRLDLRTWETGVTEVTQCTDGLIAIDRGFENNKSRSSGVQRFSVMPLIYGVHKPDGVRGAPFARIINLWQQLS